MSTLDQVISGAEFIQEDEKQDFYLDHDAEKWISPLFMSCWLISMESENFR